MPIVWFIAVVLLVGLYVLVGEISFRYGKSVGWTQGYADKVIEDNKARVSDRLNIYDGQVRHMYIDSGKQE
jgi:hypothetical protein